MGGSAFELRFDKRPTSNVQRRTSKEAEARFQSLGIILIRAVGRVTNLNPDLTVSGELEERDEALFELSAGEFGQFIASDGLVDGVFA